MKVVAVIMIVWLLPVSLHVWLSCTQWPRFRPYGRLNGTQRPHSGACSYLKQNMSQRYCLFRRRLGGQPAHVPPHNLETPTLSSPFAPSHILFSLQYFWHVSASDYLTCCKAPVHVIYLMPVIKMLMTPNRITPVRNAHWDRIYAYSSRASKCS